MKQICFFLSTTAIIFLSACQKDFTVDNVFPLSNAALTDSNFLDKIYLSRTSGTLTDTVFTQFYSYDNNRRIISFYIPDGPATGPLSGERIRFFYAGSDTFPARSEEVFYRTSGPNDTLVTFFSFSAAGQRIRDSALYFWHEEISPGILHNFMYKKIIAYEYLPGKIYAKTLETQLQDDSPIPYIGLLFTYSDTATRDANNNIISHTQWKSYFNLDIIVSSSVFTYDANPNPFKKNGFYKGVSIFPNGCETFLEYMASTNNRLHALEGNGSGGVCSDEDFTNKYTYNAAGFPKQITYLNGSSTEKIIFVYRTL